MDKQKILIVDNEPLAISQLVEFLSDESYEVFTAENGMAGLEILRKVKIDLAVVEIDIGDLNGITLLKEVKREKIQTVVLIFTGFGSAEIGATAIKFGAVDVVDKPVMRNEFLEKINEHLPVRDLWRKSLESFFDQYYEDAALSLGYMARKFGCSKTSICILLKKHLGTSFKQRLLEVRLAKAEALLVKSQKFCKIVAP
ncbi:MAG: response regulator [Gemmatimonadetes bacterium]|nr:response regulator [Gemmatimonadota bacterium]